MAKKQTKTQALRAKVKRQIRAMEKRGFEVSEEVKESISKANYSRLSSYQKNKYKRLYSESRYIDYDTGEILSGTKGRNVRRWRKTADRPKPAKKPSGEWVDFSDLAGTFDPETGEIFDAESEFYNRTGYNQSGNMSNDERADVIVSNVVEDFIDKLSQEIPDYYYTSNGKRKNVNPWAKRAMEEAQTTLLNLAYNELYQGKKEELAERLERNASEVSLLITKLYSDSDSAQINASRARLSYIIAGRNLSINELMDLEAEQVISDGYEEI